MGRYGRARPDCIWIGGVDRAELREAWSWVAGRYSVTRWPTPLAALDPLRPPDDLSPSMPASAEGRASLVILVQDYPQQFSEEMIERLFGRWPQAQHVVLCSEWGGGFRRTAQPNRQGTMLLRAGAGSGRAVWGGLQRRADGQPSGDGGKGAAGPPALLIGCRQAELAEGLAELLAELGWASFWTPPGRRHVVAGIATILWDVPPEEHRRRTEWRDWRRRFPNTRVIALVDFARHHDVQNLVALGAWAVLDKPPTAEQLEVVLGRTD